MSVEMQQAQSDSTEVELREWAGIFNTFGQSALREVLSDAAGQVSEDGHMIVEFQQTSDGPIAIDITNHVEELEDEVSSTEFDAV